MKCKNCGREIDKSWGFCYYCGEKVEGSANRRTRRNRENGKTSRDIKLQAKPPGVMRFAAVYQGAGALILILAGILYIPSYIEYVPYDTMVFIIAVITLMVSPFLYIGKKWAGRYALVLAIIYILFFSLPIGLALFFSIFNFIVPFLLGPIYTSNTTGFLNYLILLSPIYGNYQDSPTFITMVFADLGEIIYALLIVYSFKKKILY